MYFSWYLGVQSPLIAGLAQKITCRVGSCASTPASKDDPPLDNNQLGEELSYTEQLGRVARVSILSSTGQCWLHLLLQDGAGG